MTIEALKEQNRRLRHQLRDTKNALRDAEDSLAWVAEQLNTRAASTKREG